MLQVIVDYYRVDLILYSRLNEIGSLRYFFIVKCQNFWLIKGPLFWSSGRRARLLLERSEFESSCSLQFFSVKYC